MGASLDAGPYANYDITSRSRGREDGVLHDATSSKLHEGQALSGGTRRKRVF